MHLATQTDDPLCGAARGEEDENDRPVNVTGRVDLVTCLECLRAHAVQSWDNIHEAEGKVRDTEERLQKALAPPGAVRSNHGLDTTNENRRLRTVLDTLLKRENVTAATVDFMWNAHGYNVVICCPNGDAAELRMADALLPMLEQINASLGVMVQAARLVEADHPEFGTWWTAEIDQLVAAWDAQRAADGDTDGEG